MGEIDQHKGEVPDCVVDLYDELISKNCTPPVAAATVTYVAGVVANEKITQDDVAQEFNVSIHSINKWKTEFDGISIAQHYSIKKDCESSDLIKELSNGEKIPHSVGELADAVRWHSGIEITRPKVSNFSKDEMENLTGSGNSLEQVEILKRDYDIQFGEGSNDANLDITLNKRGFKKIVDRLTES